MISRLLPVVFAVGLTGSALALDNTAVSTTNPPLTSFTEEKPAFLYFKEGTFKRDGKMKIDVDITLDGPIPNALTDRKVIFYIGFDIDNNGGTGTSSLTFPGFGSDMSLYITKEEKELKFTASSSSLVHKGKPIEIKVTKLKVTGDKITCELSSEMFGAYDSMRIFVLSQQEFFERNLSKGNQTIDQLPRKGAMTLGREK